MVSAALIVVAVVGGAAAVAVAGYAYGRIRRRLTVVGNPNGTYVRFYPNPGFSVGPLTRPWLYWSKAFGLFHRKKPNRVRKDRNAYHRYAKRILDKVDGGKF